MKLKEDVKPISYFKAHASDIMREIVAGQKIVVITQHGEAKAILQNIHEYEKTQESLALLKILALSRKSLEEGKRKPFREAFKDVRKKAAGFREK